MQKRICVIKEVILCVCCSVIHVTVDATAGERLLWLKHPSLLDQEKQVIMDLLFNLPHDECLFGETVTSMLQF